MSSQLRLATRDNDARFASEQELGTETCESCRRVMEERWRDMWFVIGPNSDHRMESEPISGPGQRLVCSQRCLSQLVYDSAPEETRELMRISARQIHNWFETVNLKSVSWCLSHSYVTHAVSHTAWVILDYEMNEFAKKLLGDNWRDENNPEWFEQAIAPKREPVQLFMPGVTA
jgi:hypothetical protein